MTDATPKRGFGTSLTHGGRISKNEHGFVNPPVLRGSTVLVPTVAERKAMAARAGRAGADLRHRRPTHWALEDVHGGDRGRHALHIVGTGLAAVTTPLLAWLKAGDHCLMPDHVYGPARTFATTMLRRLGVETTYTRRRWTKPGWRR